MIFEFTGTPSFFSGERWRVSPGQQWVITGGNASGKTTLALLITGKMPLKGAELSFGSGLSEADAALVTFAQQGGAVADGWMQARWYASLETDEQTVGAFLSYKRVNGINPFEIRDPDPAREAAFEARRRELFSLLHLHELADRRVIQLSNGEMRRLLLAAALLKLPKILILDDPFAGLDPLMQTHLHAVLAQLAAEGVSLILTVRHEDEIPACITHRLHLENFRIVKQSAFTPKAAHETARLPETEANLAPSTTPEVIRFRDVTLTYGQKTIFDHFNWRVHAGERWLVVGPNGCGKSTLISLITGDNPRAYAFDVQIFGQARGGGVPLWSIRSRIGHVSPEMQAFFTPGMSCLEAVLSGCVSETGEIRPVTAESEAIARGWLTRLGLEQSIDCRVGTLSAGHQRLVLVARALMPEPDILLLDELCMNLDENARAHLLGMLGEVLDHRPDATVVCVAHRPDDVPRGFRRVLNLSHSK